MIFLLITLIVTGIVLLCYLVYKANISKLNAVQDEMQKIRRDLRNLEHSALSDMQRLSRLENYAKSLSERQDSVLARSADGSYMHAGKMVEMGASLQDIIDSCGLTRAEADLVVTMYGKK